VAKEGAVLRIIVSIPLVTSIPQLSAIHVMGILMNRDVLFLWNHFIRGSILETNSASNARQNRKTKRKKGRGKRKRHTDSLRNNF
jgi:hypothetical protein